MLDKFEQKENNSRPLDSVDVQGLELLYAFGK